MVVIKTLWILALVYLAAYLLIFRHKSHRWGATGAERRQSLPGDDLVPVTKVGYTQAITIHAASEEVWPWLVQVGYGRGGWYSHEWVFRILGADDFHDGNHSANRIIPELQILKVGDTIKISQQASFEVIALEPNQFLVLLARVDLDTDKSFELGESMPVRYVNSSWLFFLEKADENGTRLVVRWRGNYSPGFANALGLAIPTEMWALMMQPRMLRGIKARAEATGSANG